MSLSNVTIGKDSPSVVNVVIEIRRGEGHNKYEIDKETGVLVLDRVNATTLGYPADYGYVPQTLCEDGDPIDALLIIDESVPQGVVVPSRPIGVLRMVDDGEGDEKLIMVADDDVTKKHIQDISDLGPEFPKVIEHFYAHYKDWKKGWTGSPVSFNGWGGKDEAAKVLQESIDRAKK